MRWSASSEAGCLTYAFAKGGDELGGAATLLVADARDYLRVILDRHGHPYGVIRKLMNWEELTSRIMIDRIPANIEKLEKRYDSARPHDAQEA